MAPSRKLILAQTWLWLPPLLYMALIFQFSSESDPLPDLTAAVWDKALHTAEFAGLAILLGRALRGEGLAWLMSIVLATLVASGYGALDEWHQWFVPGRDSDIHDWLADTLGGLVGAVTYLTLVTSSQAFSRCRAGTRRLSRSNGAP